VILSCTLLLPIRALAVGISFETVDLPDSTPGDDLWEYAYRVQGFDFSRDQGFSVFFDPGLYGALSTPVPVGSDWDLLAIQPDRFLGPGLYDALARVDHATVDVSFRIAFVWLGGFGRTPGSQAFEIFEQDADGNFLGDIASGATLPVPEPGTATMLALGLFSTALHARRRLRRQAVPRRTPTT
jgi:hypothetical protein